MTYNVDTSYANGSPAVAQHTLQCGRSSMPSLNQFLQQDVGGVSWLYSWDLNGKPLDTVIEVAVQLTKEPPKPPKFTRPQGSGFVLPFEVTERKIYA